MSSLNAISRLAGIETLDTHSKIEELPRERGAPAWPQFQPGEMMIWSGHTFAIIYNKSNRIVDNESGYTEISSFFLDS
jgi:hypothetical protein